MPLKRCPKCGEEYNPMYFEHECQKGGKQLGFGWGYVWIGLSIFSGFMATVGMIVFLIFFLPKIELPLISVWMAMLGFLGFILFLGVFVGLPIVYIIGLLQQKKWGLYLVYTELGLIVLGRIISLTRETESFIFTIISLAIIYLWFSYFYRRRSWFNVDKEKILLPLADTFPSSWDFKDTLTVVVLILLLPIGLILMWTIGKWPIRAKITITIVSLSPFILVSILALWVTLRFRAFL